MIRLTVEKAVERLAHRAQSGGGRVYVPGCAAEPLIFHEAFAAQPEAAAGLTFVGVWIPGINRRDWSALHPTARAETTFVSPDWRAGFAAGRVAVHPLGYRRSWDWLATTPLDAAMVQVCAPDAQGMCALGMTADFAGAVLGRGVFTVAHVNPAMPAPLDGPKVALSAFDVVVEAERALPQFEAGTLGEAFAAIGDRIGEWIGPGAAVQFGLGKAGLAAMAAIVGHTNVRIHSGMAADPLLAALEAGALAEGPGAVTIGAALGNDRLYQRLASDPRVRFAPVDHTHEVAVMARIPRLIAVNSALEVDLFGQANAEFMDGRQVSGTGGLNDFLRGAAASPGGVGIIALSASAGAGRISRIVPRLNAGAVSVTRADMGVVITEHGCADLRGLDVDARARALTALAAPQHREGLARAWSELRAAM